MYSRPLKEKKSDGIKKIILHKIHKDMRCYLVSVELHSEPSQTIKIKVFAKIVDSFLPLTFSAKKFHPRLLLGSEYALAIYYYTDCGLKHAGSV